MGKIALKILYLITLPDLGGAQVHLLTVASEMAARGHGVLVVVGRAGWLTARLQGAGIESVIVPDLVREISPCRDMRAVLAIRRLLLERRPDLVHCHSSKAGIVGRLAAWLLGIPSIFTAHGWAFTEGVAPLKRRFYQWLEMAAGFWARRIVCVSEYDRRLGCQWLPMHGKKMVTIYNGISPEASMRSEVSSGALRLVMVARFAPPKCQEDVLRALDRLREHGEKLTIEVDFIGEGTTCARVQRMAQQLGLEDTVRFLGNRTDVPALLPRYGGCLLISQWEGFPISILEAMRAGLPVIASHVGGVAEAVTEGENGFLVPKGDITVLAEKIRYAAQHREDFATMGQRGRQMFLAQFTAEKMMTQLVSLYEACR
ncbi:MAG: glycosyltransferase family 4 protein [Schwartzia sp. (in: firmicutes)]